MKSFINDPNNIVNESILGLLADDRLAVLDRFPEIRVVVRKDWDKSKVALLSGGGSGHEPAHAGFVGKGMLTAAVCGDVFASPTVDAVLSGILAITGDAGCLVIIKNYTGDRLNFGLAVEEARLMGYNVETVTVGDDIALGDDVQKRGVAGTLFVHKIAGYLAEEGYSLKEIATIAQRVANEAMSMGIALSECQMFHNAKPSRLTDNEAELGLGIHGEPGTEIIPMEKADQLIKLMTDHLEKEIRSRGQTQARFVLLMNNLGTVTPLEMNLLVHALTKTNLAEHIDYLIGPDHFMTALNMSGISLSLLPLDDLIIKALQAPVEPSAWTAIHPLSKPATIASPNLPEVLQRTASNNEMVYSIVETIANTFIEIEAKLNQLDAKVGDGDAGVTFAIASRKILEILDHLPLDDGEALLSTIGRLLSRGVGGSSGVLLSILCTAAGNNFADSNHYGKALLAGLEQMKYHGGASLGDRTMIDALEPALHAWSNDQPITEIVMAARKGADGTKLITKTLFGRSSYVPESVLKDIPDPGAEAMACILEAVGKKLS